jgi:hypothetical protein
MPRAFAYSPDFDLLRIVRHCCPFRSDLLIALKVLSLSAFIAPSVVKYSVRTRYGGFQVYLGKGKPSSLPYREGKPDQAPVLPPYPYVRIRNEVRDSDST